MILLDVIQAKDLVKSDIIGKSDPYAVVSFDGDKLKTSSVKNTQNPEWNFNANIPVDEKGPRNIKVEVFDADKLGKDKSLGSTQVDVEDVINGSPIDKLWVPLSGAKSGKIQLSAAFMPESELDELKRRPSRDGKKGPAGYGDDDFGSSPNSRKGTQQADGGRKPSDTGSEIPDGKIHFQIKEGRDLIKTDMIGKSDPYAVLTYGKKKLKTSPVKNNQNPIWNCKGDIPVDNDSPRIINLEVFDSDKLGKDKSLGSTNLDVLDIVQNTPINETWVPLDGVKSGKVKIAAEFIPDSDKLGGSPKPKYSVDKMKDDSPRRGSKFSAGGSGTLHKSDIRKPSDISIIGADNSMPGQGNVHVNVKGAKDLVKSDLIGKSDPYATITYGGDKKKSKTVKNSKNPEWNFEVDVPVNETSPRDIKIEVFDSDRFGKDKPLGYTTIDIPHLANIEPLEDAWIPLNGAKQGHIQVSADYTPEDRSGSPSSPSGKGAKSTRDKLGHQRDKDGYGSRKPSSTAGDIHDGSIHLEISQAKDLINTDLIGKSDPYAVGTYGNDQIKTKTVKNNQNPEWNFEVNIPVKPDGSNTIMIDLYDEDKKGTDKPLGSTTINIDDIANHGPINDKWIPLDLAKSGKIQISAGYVPEDGKETRRPSGTISPHGKDGKKPMEKSLSRDRMRSPDKKYSGSSDVGSPNRRPSGGRKPSDKSPAIVPGNLHINIVQAKDLIKADMVGKSDPYAVVTYGNDKIKTNTVKNSQNPEWNFEPDIPLKHNGPDFMKIEVFDNDKFGKDKSLGVANIDIPSLQHSQSLSDMWVPLDNVKSGQIQLSADFLPVPDYDSGNSQWHSSSSRRESGTRKESSDFKSFCGPGSRRESEQRPGHGGAKHVRDILSGRSSTKEEPQFQSGSLGDPRYPQSTPDDKMGTIKLNLLCGKDLVKGDMIGKSDPYAVIKYGETKYQTPIKYNTQCPEFNIQCNIDIPNNPKDRNIHISVYDSDKFGKDKCIGDMNIDIAKVMNLGKLNDEWYPLQGVKTGKLKVGADFLPDQQDDLHIHQSFTESHRSSTQYHEVSLNRIPLPSSGGDIDATIKRPSGVLDKPSIEDNNGTISVKYQPSEEGLHYLDVTFNGDQVQGSPFKFHVNKQNSGQAFGYGPGLTHGVCGEPAKFDISTKGAGAGGLSLAVEGPSKAEINCVDNKDGTVSVSFLPTAPGEYKIIAKFAEKHIPGSPFTCKITGDNKKKNQISVGSSSELQLPGDLSEADIRSLKAFIESPSGGIEQCFLKKLPKGNIGISFTPREVGEHLVSVQKNGAHISNSPFKIVVNSQEVGDAKRVKVSGEGLDRGKTHIFNQFQINTKSAGYGGLSLSIEGPSKAEIDCKDNEDGTLDVEYKPTEPGFYIVNIKFADSHIPGSPFQVPISGEGSEKQMENIKRMREAVPVTEVGSQCRLTFKMPGINMKDLEAHVSSPSGKVSKAKMTELEEGLYAVNFVPYELGVHTVTVRYREMDIPD